MKNTRTTKYVDLRCSRRLTVAEARTVLQALDAAGVEAKGVRAKLGAAITLATHRCDTANKGLCSVCGSTQNQRDGLRTRRAEDLTARLRKSKDMQDRLRKEDRQRAAFERPNLKYTGGGT